MSISAFPWLMMFKGGEGVMWIIKVSHQHTLPLYFVLLCNSFKSVISSQSKLSTSYPNKIDHILSNHFGFKPRGVFKLCQTSKIEGFSKIVHSFQLLTNFARYYILDVCEGSEYAWICRFVERRVKPETELFCIGCWRVLSVGKTWNIL